MSEELDPWESELKSKLGNYRRDFDLSDEKVNSFLDEINEETPASSNKSYKNYLALAASFVAILSALFAVYKSKEVTVVSGGLVAKQEVLLPDGSRVLLRQSSSLQYNSWSWRFNRNVSLEGEAYFEVSKGSDFKVESTMGNTTVLGTSFNILANEGTYEVKCFEGKVQVEIKSETYVLNPGNSVASRLGQVKENNFDIDEISWHQEELVFDDEPIHYVFQRLGEVYNREFVLPAELRDEKYTGFFPADDLALALRLVLEPLSLEAQFVEGDKVIISKIIN